MGYTSERLDKKYCQIQGWINLVHICIMHQNHASGIRREWFTLKERYAVALDSCYIFSKNVKHGIEHDVDSAYGVCIHYRHSWTLWHILMNTLQFN